MSAQLSSSRRAVDEPAPAPRGPLKRFCRVALALALAATFGLALACTHLGYYSQSAWGGLKILAKRKPIADLLGSPALDPQLRRQLEQIVELRDFASAELGLPDNRSYRSYVELDRRYAVWNVVAAPRFAVEPRVWCFLFAGCVSYRGYFSERRARRFAARQASRGDDVAVGGVVAYSTLGWFADPVLSTFVDGAEEELAGLIFHELAHQRLYVKDDTPFNESFATVVEEEGVRRWLIARGLAQRLAAVDAAARERLAVNQLIVDYRDRLAVVYAEPLTAGAMAARKAGLLGALRQDYLALRAQSAGEGLALDDWFAQDLNNAHLAAIGAYFAAVPPLRALLAREHNELEAFYAAAEQLGGLDLESRQRRLDELAGVD